MNSRTESELAFFSVEQAARLLRKREISPVELVDAALAGIERGSPGLNAFLTIVGDDARLKAHAAEREFRRGKESLKSRGPLFGIPISIKDNFWTRGVRTTAGSRILTNFVPEQDSDVAKSLALAGAILLGKTNMHEFAYGITNENPHYGPVRNPWARERISGGSSGGSAAAVATGMCFASMGTDTGGSIRIPASLCGIVGLKPTFCLVSLEGVVPLAESLDHAGPLGRSVTDVCIMLEAVAGEFPKGATRPNHRKLSETVPRRFRLGWPREYFFDQVDAEVRLAVEAAATLFQSLGARIEEVALPHLKDSVEPSTNIAMVEASRYHMSQGYFPARAAEYGVDVRKRLELGCEVRAIDYLRAFEVKREVVKEFEAAYERVGAIIAPTLPIAAPRLGENELTVAGAKETVRSALVRMNRPANFTGIPAISLPCGFTRAGLPIGLQLIGPRWSEARLLAIAAAYEQATEWHKRRPPFN